MARREKKPVHKVVMTEGKRNIIQQLLQEYDIETAEDIQDALKDLLGGTIKEMMEAEMDDRMTILDMVNQNAQTRTTIGMVTKVSGLTAVMVQWRLMFHRIVSLHLSRR